MTRHAGLLRLSPERSVFRARGTKMEFADDIRQKREAALQWKNNICIWMLKNLDQLVGTEFIVSIEVDGYRGVQTLPVAVMVRLLTHAVCS